MQSVLMIQTTGVICVTAAIGFQVTSVLQSKTFSWVSIYIIIHESKGSQCMCYYLRAGFSEQCGQVLLSARWHKHYANVMFFSCTQPEPRILWRHTPLMWISANLPPAVTNLLQTWPSCLSSCFISADPCHHSDIQRTYGADLWHRGTQIWPNGKQAMKDTERMLLSSQAKTVGTVLDISRPLYRGFSAWKKMHSLFHDSQSK